ncbi:hypothetical protein FHR32_000967 [Streptosporangium album]|uniref:Uncharacterized protein n=1 Tax=Streptosporangium album TaxID=47479 RepID=A0A7W7RR68_9ACTN|nr:hypothetical protein [Streptosporangium album]
MKTSGLAALPWRRDFTGSCGDLSEDWHAEVHIGRPSCRFQLGELLLCSGEADLESFDSD